MTKSPITTHILDLHVGRPASGVGVELYSPDSDSPISTTTTDADGRVLLWPEPFELTKGTWTIRFKTESWFKTLIRASFFADVDLRFNVESVEEHYHVPLLLNEFGYSTYRGS